MKKTFFFNVAMALVAIAALTISCNEKDDYLFGAKDAFVKVVNKGVKTLIINSQEHNSYCLVSSNAPWKVSSSETWINCITKEGEFNDTLRFSVEKNIENLREGMIFVKNTKGTPQVDTLKVTQMFNDDFLPDDVTLEVKPIDLPEAIESDVFAEFKFEVSTTLDWVAYTKTDNFITLLSKQGSGKSVGSFAIKNNDSLESREDTIYVASTLYSSLVTKFVVKQKGRPVDLKIIAPANKSVLLDSQESHFAFDVKADGKWTVSTDASWLTIEKAENEGNTFVKVTATATTSPRSAKISVQSSFDKTKVDVLNVEQRIIPSGRLKDSLALVAIYNATAGERWVYNWKFELPLSEANWPGVFFDHVNGELRVVDLSLAMFNLEGTIPSEIGWLTELVKVKMQHNKLSGTIPSSFNRLTNLTHIYLSSNKLTGSIPALPNLSKLERLELDFNRLEGEIPPELLLLDRLKEIRAKFNKLDPDACVSGRFGGWRIMFLNPQRVTYGDASTNYNLKPCS